MRDTSAARPGVGVEMTVVEGDRRTRVPQIGQDRERIGEPVVGEAVGAVGPLHDVASREESHLPTGSEHSSAPAVANRPPPATAAAWSRIRPRMLRRTACRTFSGSGRARNPAWTGRVERDSRR